MAIVGTASDAMESLLDRNTTLQAEVRQLRAALARVEALCDRADKVSTGARMAVAVDAVREAIRLRP